MNSYELKEHWTNVFLYNRLELVVKAFCADDEMKKLFEKTAFECGAIGVISDDNTIEVSAIFKDMPKRNFVRKIL